MKVLFSKIVPVAAFLFILSSCFAQTPTETLNVSGLKENVIVRRDERSIPYIEAKNNADLYFAQGFVTAQDRLWQMDLYRRVASGTTAELFGNAALEEDKRWRRFGFSGLVQETYKNFSPEYKSVLDNYARGVNAYITSLDDNSMPTEFKILQYKPAEWKPTDSLIIGKILTDALSTTWYEDATRAKFKNLPKEQFDQLFIEKTPFDVLVVGKDSGETQKSKAKTAGLADVQNLFEAAKLDQNIRKQSLEKIGFYQEFNAASNNWVVSGKRTLDGKPILANDPHLRPSAPSIWYMANLSGKDSRVSGVTLPGVPGIILGHNQNIAWGATNLGPDVQDLYVEEFNGKNEYKTEKGFEAAEVRTEEIKVRQNLLKPDVEIVKFEVVSTDDGVIIQNAGDKKIALKWTALDAKNNEFEAFYLLNRAKDWSDFNAALKTYGGATQNFVYADVKGNIGFHNGGAIPIRSSGDGSFPYDGAKNDGKWSKYIPFEELPGSYNPPEGFIVTANQRLAGDSYKYFLGHSWAAPYRARRIYQLLQANSKMTIADNMDIQRDVYSISYANFASEIVKLEAASNESLKMLRGWDGKTDIDSTAPILVLEIRGEFLKKILVGTIGKEKADAYQWSNVNSFIDWLLREKPANWLPKEFASYKELLLKSDEAARASLIKKYGADESKWAWGSIDKIRFSHPLAAAPLIGSVFAIEPLPYRGSGTSPNVGAAVSMRFVTVPGNWDETRQGITLGESGNPRSPFYKDQLKSWSQGNTPIFPFSKEAVEKAATRVILMKSEN